MKSAAPPPFGAQLKALREAAGFTQEELATIAGLSVHAISALERGERRRPHVDTVRALSAALDLAPAVRETFVASSRIAARDTAVDELRAVGLPLPLTALVGRDKDVRVLREWLADPAARLITLVGPGGVGKSRLALDLARAVAEESTTRVAFIPLAAIRDRGLAACAIAEALGLADISAADLPRRALGACGDRPTMLVLDNFEQVLDAAATVAEVLTSAPPLRMLVTSRIPLRVRGEREYAVEPLPVTKDAEPLSPADLARVPAVCLFVERARDVQRDFSVTAANGSTINEICRRLDGLPLAIELAARWIKVLPPADLVRRLERDVLLSSGGARDLPERQQTMTATVAWSYQLLNVDEQRAFRRLSVLPDRFPIDAAAAVLSDAAMPVASDQALAAVTSLIDKSLLVAEPAVAGRPLYRMLETVRAYAAQELTANGEHDDAREGLVRYCLEESSLCVSGLVGPAQIEWLDRVHHDLETYRSALMWLVPERGRPADASDILWRLLSFWMIRGHAAEAIWWNEEVLKLPSVPANARAKALINLAIICYSQGQLERSRHDLERGLALARDTGATDLIAPAEILLGHVEYAVGNVSGARERFMRCLDVFRAADIPWGIGNALTGLAGIAVAAGDTTHADHLLDEAATVLRRAGPWYLALALYWRAVLAVRRGDADAALAFVRESLTRVRELHDKLAFVHAMVPLAAAAALKGDYAWTARILAAEDVVRERTGAMVLDHAVRDLRQQTERDARARLGPERWEQAYAAGRTSSIDALLEDIDRSADALVE